MSDEVVSVQCLSEVVTLYILQFATDVHHATGDIRSTHADDIEMKLEMGLKF